MTEEAVAGVIAAEIPKQIVGLIPASIPPTTTSEQNLVTAGQRRINLIWEWTQSIISVSVVLANMIVAVYDGVNTNAPAFPTVLSSALFLVVGFYFSRTNHSAIGGVGDKTATVYAGR
jgi:hypothetical protein